MKFTSFYTLAWTVLLTYFLISCDETSELPTLSTDPVTSIGVVRAVSGGTIISVGDEVILQKGVCWSTNPQPTFNDEVTNEGSGNDSFTSLITGLMGNADYYVRSYAQTKTGIGYGPQLEFKTDTCPVPDSIYHVCDEDITSYPGTACCVSGPTRVTPGETLTYRYISNIPNAEITWIVSYGSMTLISGQNTAIASFKFGDDFTSGCFIVSGENESKCGMSLGISSQ